MEGEDPCVTLGGGQNCLRSFFLVKVSSLLNFQFSTSKICYFIFKDDLIPCFTSVIYFLHDNYHFLSFYSGIFHKKSF